MVLKSVKEFEIFPTSPFNFDATFHKPDHFTTSDHLWQPGIRWQSWRWQGEELGLKFVNLGTLADPKIKVKIFSKSTLTGRFTDSLIAEIRYRFNLDLELSRFYLQFKDDPTLGPVINRWLGMRPGHPSSLYEYLIIGIVLQNATVARSIQMFKVLLESYGTPLEFDGLKLECFWYPGKLAWVSEDELRALKIGYRAKSIKRVDQEFAQKKIDELGLRAQSLQTQKERLLSLYGVGPATVWYLLFDVFHHWDFFDHVSPWEQKIYSKLFFDQDPEKPVEVKKILKRFEKYAPFQQLAVHYIWEDLWWQRKTQKIDWLEKLIRI